MYIDKILGKGNNSIILLCFYAAFPAETGKDPGLAWSFPWPGLHPPGETPPPC